jgi:hypothetical protein
MIRRIDKLLQLHLLDLTGRLRPLVKEQACFRESGRRSDVGYDTVWDEMLISMPSAALN